MTAQIQALAANVREVSPLLLFIASLIMLVLAGCATSRPGNTKLPKGTKSSGGKHARIETNMGNMEIEFFEIDSPMAVENFRLLSEHGYYDGLTFHRVVKGFMIQGGDPDGTGTGGESAWGGQFDDKINPDSILYQRGYRRGTVAMANSGPNTNGSQFFIMHQDSRLPPNYVIFGNVVKGQAVVDALAEVPTVRGGGGEMSRPTQPLIIRKIVLIP